VAAAAHVHDEVQGGAGKKETFIIYASLSLAPHIQTLPIFVHITYGRGLDLLR